jgi:hypothetical protein
MILFVIPVALDLLISVNTILENGSILTNERLKAVRVIPHRWRLKAERIATFGGLTMLKKVRVNDAAIELRMARFKWMWKTNPAA